MDVASVFNMWLVSGCEQKVFKLYFSLNQRTAVRDAKNAVATILSLKTNQKWFSCYLLPCSFKIFVTVFPFLYVRANCKEICQEITFPSFLRKMLMSACLLRFKVNCLKKIHGYPHFSLWILIALPRIYFFPPDPNLAQKPLYLIGTILKQGRCSSLSVAQDTWSILEKKSESS